VSAFYLPVALDKIYLQLHYLLLPTNGAKTFHPVDEKRETISWMFERPSNPQIICLGKCPIATQKLFGWIKIAEQCAFPF